MRRLVVVLFLGSLASPLTAAGFREHRGRVHQVIDGDTIMVGAAGKAAEVVRLLGIDTPEDFGKDARRRAWAAAARNAMIELCGGKDVKLRVQPGAERDRFGRLLAYVDLTDGTEVNAAMLRRGLALHYRKYPHPELALFDRLESEARSAGRGVFAKRGPATAMRPDPAPARKAPARRVATREREEDLPKYFVTVTGKIHKGTCDSEFVVRDRKAGKIEPYDSYQAATEGKPRGGKARWKGTSSCKVCKPYLW